MEHEYEAQKVFGWRVATAYPLQGGNALEGE
jgi:hypothetical protein